MADECKAVGETVLKWLQYLNTSNDSELQRKDAISKLEQVATLAENINVSLMGENAGNLADMLENEMLEMDKAIEEAVVRIQVQIFLYSESQNSLCFLGYALKIARRRLWD